MKPIFRHLLLVIAAAVPTLCIAQSFPALPIEDYEERTDTKPHDIPEVWQAQKVPVQLSWGTTDVRYARQNVPEEAAKPIARIQAKGWRGERIQAQAVLWTSRALTNVSVSVSDLTAGWAVIPSSALSTHFVRYVMTDEPNADGTGCGYRDNKAEWDSSIVADVLDIIAQRNVEACSTQPLWVKLWIPYDAQAGKYKGTVTVTADEVEPMTLQLEVEVSPRTLTRPKDWGMNLDMWQNPYAIARYYNVPLWSKAHFDLMRPIMQMLADAGQRAITTTIMHKPWNGQTEDYFSSMVTRIRHIDGSWSYDYTVFDRWVAFMKDEVGIDGLICCYTMIPWALRFDYYDQATNETRFIKTRPGDEAYADYWGSFLKDFSRHLREKGWFEQTAISMDERSVNDMREAIKVIKDADPEFKISLAGGYHPEILSDLYYLSVPYGTTFPDSVKAERCRSGQLSCVYTCCSEAFPNIFTFSPPAEAAWTAVHALAGGYDGFLRWSVTAWTADPLRDSRFRLFAAGDTYSIYPGPRSSIRFERLVEGLQYCEKIRLLRQELTARGDKAKLEKLNKVVAKFTPEGFEAAGQTAAEMVSELRDLLNAL